MTASLCRGKGRGANGRKSFWILFVNGARGGLEADPSCSADCSAPTAQIAAQHVPAGSGREPHQKTEPAATTRVTAGSARITPVSKTGSMAGTGFEKPRFSSGKPGVAPTCSAESSALSSDLALVVDSWARLPEAVRAGVLAMVKATRG